MEKELTIAIQAAVLAGREIMKIYNSGDFHIQFKDDTSPLTIADQKANTIIEQYLQKTSIPIISEETKLVSYKERARWKKCWIVDPLDGTKEFIKRNGEFTVNIALVENGEPVLGVIYVPVSRMLYYAIVKNKCAYKVKVEKNETNENIFEKATAIGPSSNGEVIRVVGSRSHMNDETLDFIEELKNKHSKTVEIVSIGSSLKFCLIAEGLADVYPRFAPTMEWDTAAGQAICEAVNLKVIDDRLKTRMRYNRENLLNNFFSVSNFDEGAFMD